MYRIKTINLIGLRFGKLLVTEIGKKSAPPRRDQYWICVCDCGKEHQVSTWHLRSGNTKSCGCGQIERARNLKLKAPGEAALTELFYAYRYDAKDRNLPFELTKDEFKNLTLGNCYHCGAKPAQIKSARSRNGDYLHNGIDRLNSEIGYNTENCVSCCKRCNFMKLDMTVEQFLQACQAVVDHQSINAPREIVANQQ